MTEAQHQAALMKWTQQAGVRAKYPELKFLFHVPNGGARNPIEGKHLKAAGVKRGVPDLMLPVPRGVYHGLWIELKTDKGKASPEQEWWIAELRKNGYAAEVRRGWKEAVGLLVKYLEEQP